jgi:transcriptional regulator with XRE-family HTH domain
VLTLVRHMPIVWRMTHLTLRETRMKRGMTQDQLAEKSGVDQTTISSIEIGRRTPSDDIKKRLAAALGTAPSRIRFTAPEPTRKVAANRDKAGHTRPEAR